MRTVTRSAALFMKEEEQLVIYMMCVVAQTCHNFIFYYVAQAVTVLEFFHFQPCCEMQ